MAADIEPLVHARRQHILRSAQSIPEQDRGAFLYRHDVLPFRAYQEATRYAERWQRELRRQGAVRSAATDTWSLRAFLQATYHPDRHTPDLAGWVQYLCDVSPGFADHLPRSGRPVALPEPVRQMHTLITAASGWGKSELLKTLIHHYVAHPIASVVVLDPHGDMAPQIARWPEFRGSDRLVYIEPNLSPGQTVGLNPLDARGLDEDGIAVFADQLGIAIGELSSDLTGNMEMVGRACARVLLEDGNATLFDLLDLIENPPKRRGEERTENPNRARLIARGQAHPDWIVARFFNGRLEADSLRSAREGMDNRISRLLFLPRFQEMTCGPASIHLESLLNQRKVIVCNLAPLGSSGAAAMGRLIVALVAAIGHRREGTDKARRVPCHVFVDEAQTMASKSMGSILFELRKFGIHLTLAQQVEGVGFDDAGQKAIANSTATKFVGANVKAALRPVFGDGDPPSDAAPLRRGEFWTRWGQGAEPMRIQVRSDLADEGHTISAREWEALKARQVETYYRGAKERMPVRETPRPAAAPAAGKPPIAPMPAPTPAAPASPGLDLPLE